MASETEQKPTEGPWTIRRSNDGSGDVGITAPGLRNVLAECFGALRHSGERAVDEAYSNARLIVAAPEMLAALKKASQLASIACDWNLDEVEIDGKMVRTRNLRREFDAAIAKATF